MTQKSETAGGLRLLSGGFDVDELPGCVDFENKARTHFSQAILRPAQLDLFVAPPTQPHLPASPIVGAPVRFAERNCDRCGHEKALIGEGRGPHAGEILCARCHSHRGWLAKSTAAWLGSVVTKFGAPTTPIVLRHWPEGAP
ncbi:MAG: hypothetical protein ACJ8F3_08715 [Xanthobacteraceae bacterium]